MKQLKFYDVKKKNSFNTTNYKLKTKQTTRGLRYFAIADKGDHKCWRIVSKDFYTKNKK